MERARGESDGGGELATKWGGEAVDAGGIWEIRRDISI
jgi:hypothetical protein